MARIPTQNEPGSQPIAQANQIASQSANLVAQTIASGQSRIANTLIGRASGRIRQAEETRKSQIDRAEQIKESRKLIEAEQQVRQFTEIAVKRAQEDAEKTGDLQDAGAMQEAIRKFAQTKAPILFDDRSKLKFDTSVSSFEQVAVRGIDNINNEVEKKQMINTVETASKLALKNIVRIDRVPTKTDYNQAIDEMTDTYSALGFKGKALDNLVNPHKEAFANVFLEYITQVGIKNITAEGIVEFNGNPISPMGAALKESIINTKLPVDINLKRDLIDKIESQSKVAVQDFRQIQNQNKLLSNVFSGQTDPTNKKTKEVVNLVFTDFANSIGISSDNTTNFINRQSSVEEVEHALNLFMGMHKNLRTMPEQITNYIKDKAFNPQSDKDFNDAIILHDRLSKINKTGDLIVDRDQVRTQQAYLNSLSDTEISDIENMKKTYSNHLNVASAVESITKKKLGSQSRDQALLAMRQAGLTEEKIVTEIKDAFDLSPIFDATWENPANIANIVTEYKDAYIQSYLNAPNSEAAQETALQHLKKNFIKYEDFNSKEMFIKNHGSHVDPDLLNDKIMDSLKQMTEEDARIHFSGPQLEQLGFDTDIAFAGLRARWTDIDVKPVQLDPNTKLIDPKTGVVVLEFGLISPITKELIYIDTPSGRQEILKVRYIQDNSLAQLENESTVVELAE